MNPWGNSWGDTAGGGGGPDGIEEHLAKQRKAGAHLYAKQPDELPITAPVAASAPVPVQHQVIKLPTVGALEDVLPRQAAPAAIPAPIVAKKPAPQEPNHQEEEDFILALLHLEIA